MKNINKIFILICLICVVRGNLSAQIRIVDSLKLALKNAKHDTTRCNILSELAGSVIDQEWRTFNERLKKLTEENIAHNTGYKNIYLKNLSNALNNLGIFYDDQGDVPRALEYYYRSLKLREEIGDKRGISMSLSNIGLIYSNQSDISNALKYLHKSLKIKEEIGDKDGMAISLNNLGAIYQDQGDIPKALECLQKSLSLFEEVANKIGMASSLNNIAGIYYGQGDSPKALEYFHKSLKIREEIGDKKGIAYSLNNIARLLIKKEDNAGALIFANKGMHMAKEIGYPENIKNSAKTLKQIYRKQNKYKEAFEMYELEIKMRDSINNQETQKAAVKKQMQYTYEKQEAVAQAEHKSELEKQQAVADEKSRKQKIVIFSVAIGLLLVVVFAAYVFKTLRATRKQKILIEHKNKEIEIKQQEILDSIRYAKRIQMAQIPSEKMVAKSLERLRKG